MKKNTRKIQIRQVAQNLFRERGYMATSMRDLAGAVGVEPASLYNHFKSKAAILQTICFDLADQFFEAVDGLDKALPPDVQLAKAIEAHIWVIAKNLDASGVFLHEWRFLDEPHLTHFKKMRYEYETRFERILHEGVQQGIFKEIDMKFYMLTLFSSMNWIYDWYKPDGKLSVNDISQQLTDLLLNGIKKATV